MKASACCQVRRRRSTRAATAAVSIDRGAGRVELLVGVGAHGEQAGEGDVGVSRDQLALALLDVGVLDRVLLGIDLALALTFGGVRDHGGLAALYVLERGVQALGLIGQRESAAYAGGEQELVQEAR